MDDSLATKINSSKDSIKRKVGRPKGSKKKDTATISLEPQAPALARLGPLAKLALADPYIGALALEIQRPDRERTLLAPWILAAESNECDLLGACYGDQI